MIKRNRLSSNIEVRKVEIGTQLTSIVTEFAVIINTHSKQF